MDEKLKETILTYIREHYTMTIATALDGLPWAASLFYVNDGFTLYFLSDPATRHSMNIAENPLIAATVNEDYHDWRAIKGVQMEGKVELVSEEAEIAKVVAIYAKKYPYVTLFLKSIMTRFPKVVSYLEKILAKLPFLPEFTTPFPAKFYKFVPSKIYFIDNEKSFGVRQELAI